MKPSRPVITITLRPDPDVADMDRALRRGLKFLLRRCGLRCVTVETEPGSTTAKTKGFIGRQAPAVCSVR